jgi:predicted transcriptional regulator
MRPDKNTSVSLTVQVSPEMRGRLIKEAQAQDRSESSIVRAALAIYFLHADNGGK